MEIKFLEIGERVSVQIDNVNVVRNQWYDASKNFKVLKKKGSFYGEPLDYIRYVAKEDDKISNEAILTVNFPPNKKQPPYSFNNQKLIENNEEIDLSQLIHLNDTADRIRITSFKENVGDFLFNGNKVYKGLEFMTYDIDKLKYTSGSGTGLPYQEIEFQVGNKERYSQNYKLTLNIDGKGILEDPIISPADSFEFRTTSALIKLVNGPIGGKVKFNVEFNTQSEQIYLADNTGSVGINEQEINRNGIFNFEGDINENGEFDINIHAYSKNVISDGSFYFNVTLESINDNTELVGESNNKIIVLNL